MVQIRRFEPAEKIKIINKSGGLLIQTNSPCKGEPYQTAELCLYKKKNLAHMPPALANIRATKYYPTKLFVRQNPLFSVFVDYLR